MNKQNRLENGGTYTTNYGKVVLCCVRLFLAYPPLSIWYSVAFLAEMPQLPGSDNEKYLPIYSFSIGK